MKKPTILLITICVALMSVSTVMAADVDFSGEYYIEGIYNSNPNLAKTDLATYYRQMRLPPPRQSFLERHKSRLALRNPRKLWDRRCDKCTKPITTTYDSARPEQVYCEDCFLSCVQ